MGINSNNPLYDYSEILMIQHLARKVRFAILLLQSPESRFPHSLFTHQGLSLHTSVRLLWPSSQASQTPNSCAPHPPTRASGSAILSILQVLLASLPRTLPGSLVKWLFCCVTSKVTLIECVLRAWIKKYHAVVIQQGNRLFDQTCLLYVD